MIIDLATARARRLTGQQPQRAQWGEAPSAQADIQIGNGGPSETESSRSARDIPEPTRIRIGDHVSTPDGFGGTRTGTVLDILDRAGIVLALVQFHGFRMMLPVTCLAPAATLHADSVPGASA